MDKIGILCDKDRVMMHEFSRRSLDRIGGRSLLSAALSFFSSYMEANVKKETDKDRLIIEEAAAAFAAGRPACDLDLEDVFEKTKKIDKAFLDNLMVPPFSISVHYSDFVDIRIQRIWRISRTVYDLLGNWQGEARFADVAKKAYAEKEFRDIIAEILHLYSLETRMLGDAIRSPFRIAIGAYVETLYYAMEEAVDELANDYTKKIYGVAAGQVSR
jgi:hypothetical protein